MNIFRLAGDMMHVVSIILLIVRLMATKNAVGISMKTQELYLVVFVCRYLDLFTSFYSVYNSTMKILYISSTAYIIYMVYKTEPYKSGYDRTQDSFLHWKLAVAPCAVLALITVLIQGFDFMEVSARFLSVYWNFILRQTTICLCYIRAAYLDFFHLFGSHLYCSAAYSIAALPRD